MAALLIKVGTLLLKQLSKPMATSFQSYVMAHPNARKAAVSASQYLHRLDVMINRSAEGKSGRAFVGDMTEEKSLEMASKFVSEGFVFAVGAGIVFFEYDRQQKKETAKKLASDAERRAMQAHAREERELALRQNQEQTDAIRGLAARMDALEASLQQRIEEALRARSRTGLFGGMFGPRAPAAAAPAGAAPT